MANTNILGPARNRVDGPAKVTGKAKYAVEFEVPRCAHAWPVVSNLAKATVTAIDTKAAEAAPGVLKVLTHQNASQPKEAEGGGGAARAQGIRIEERNPLADDKVHYAGQYVALVVAKTLEQAQYAASLVRVSYAVETPLLSMAAAQEKSEKPSKNQDENVQPKKGDVEPAPSNQSLIRVKETYSTPTEMHNPIEMSGIIAAWDGDRKLTVWNSTQFVKGVQSILARTFGLDLENVRVICPFVGGAFGCKGALWPHELLAVMAAKASGTPVKFHVPRKEMFTATGHRTPTIQTMSLAALSNGKLQAIQHVSHTVTSPVADWTESCGARSSALMYDSPTIRIEEIVYPVNVASPTFMRAPGECPGVFALECALDELSYLLQMDPVQVRLTNYAANHPIKEVPYSSKHLKEAYQIGAEKVRVVEAQPTGRPNAGWSFLGGLGHGDGDLSRAQNASLQPKPRSSRTVGRLCNAPLMTWAPALIPPSLRFRPSNSACPLRKSPSNWVSRIIPSARSPEAPTRRGPWAPPYMPSPVSCIRRWPSSP